ncbi:MAG: hypothetical protein DMG29_16235 [Acidobacteria bacterium]|nr:MAG: hypothetical protein DMG29_16235 [Acidobacteriota bacterium]
MRGFGPLGILAILVILAGNYAFVSLSAILVLVGPVVAHAVARDRLRAAQELDRKPGRRHRFRLRIQIPHEVESWCCSSVPTRSIRRTISWPETGPRSQQPCGHVRRRGLRRRERLPRVLFERFDKVFGSGVWAKTLMVLLTAGWLGLGHYSVQGLARAEQATIVGLVFGTIFAVTGRIWMLMFAHAAFDLTALAMIYWNLG